MLWIHSDHDTLPPRSTVRLTPHTRTHNVGPRDFGRHDGDDERAF